MLEGLVAGRRREMLEAHGALRWADAVLSFVCAACCLCSPGDRSLVRAKEGYLYLQTGISTTSASCAKGRITLASVREAAGTQENAQ